jgi:hypothetical protein
MAFRDAWTHLHTKSFHKNLTAKARAAKNMSRFENLEPNAAVRGILPNEVVTVVSVQRLSFEATSDPSSIS